VLVQTVRKHPELIASSKSLASGDKDWSGLPIVFDEVFVGLSRLGPSHFNTSALLHIDPDIVVNAKLLTGGLLPLSTTTASQSIYDAFLSDTKSDALLHGHSYTAHAAGCAIGVSSLKAINDKKPKSQEIGSIWDLKVVENISNLSNVEGVVAIGTVLAVTLKDSEGGGYTSGAAENIKKQLAEVKDGEFIHSRVLGNVIYFMTGLSTKESVVRNIENRIWTALQ
jgi:dethiobiotin synthetase/adenosylmethionine--8-amino-7-oxononanoate aminotransferase